MAKIKSTLDIVMERTKNLTMTQEDKDSLERKEWRDKIRGWIRLLIDRQSTVEELREDFITESARHPVVMEILRQELLEHIDPAADNEDILRVWEEVLGLDGRRIREAVGSFHSGQEAALSTHEEHVRSRLAGAGVSGSAVVPNMLADMEWPAITGELKEQFRKSIQGL